MSFVGTGAGGLFKSKTMYFHPSSGATHCKEVVTLDPSANWNSTLTFSPLSFFTHMAI